MIDLLALENRQVSWNKIISARGFHCQTCHNWQKLFYTSTSMEELRRKLERYTPYHEQYQFLLRKLMHKALSMAQRNGMD